MFPIRAHPVSWAPYLGPCLARPPLFPFPFCYQYRPFIHSSASSVPIHHSATRRPPAPLPASRFSPPAPTPVPPVSPVPRLGLAPRPRLILPLLSARGARAPTFPRPEPSPPQPAWPRLARPSTRPTIPLASSAPGPLHLQLRLRRPRICSRRDPHLPPSPALIGRCLTTDPHNKTSGSEPRPPHVQHQSAAASAPPPARFDQSKQALLPLFLSSRLLFLNWTNHEEGEFKSRPSASNEPMRAAISLVPPPHQVSLSFFTLLDQVENIARRPSNDV